MVALLYVSELLFYCAMHVYSAKLGIIAIVSCLSKTYYYTSGIVRHLEKRQVTLKIKHNKIADYIVRKDQFYAGQWSVYSTPRYQHNLTS